MNRTVTFTKPSEVKIILSDIPQPQDDEVLIKTSRSLVSTGTELTILSGEFPKESRWNDYGQYPFKAGYSAVGKIIKTGNNVDRSWMDQRVIGGNHSAYCTIPAVNLVRLPDEIADEQAAFHSLAVIAANGVRRSRTNWGESVVIFGLGLLGQLAVRFCALNGARPIIAVDVSPERIAMLPDHPYLHKINAQKENVAEMVEKLTVGRMADVIFEVTGNQNLINGEFDSLKEQGRFIMLSSPRGTTNFDFHDRCNSFSYEIIGAHVCSHPLHETPFNPWTKKRNIELFFKHIVYNDLNIASLITHREKADNAPAVYQSLMEDRSKAMGVILEW